MITENYEAYADGGTQKDFRISVVGEETVIENSNMLTESIKLDEALCSGENLRFGCCEASQFTVQVANVFDNFEGKKLAVTVTMDEETTKYGTFKVLSDKPTADRVWRTITAYDAMRDIINADVLEWYNALTFPMTIRAFRDSFFNHLGITQKAVTLINDSFQVQQGFSATGSLSGKTIITAICEFNGVFGHINRDGNFDYVSLDSASSFNCPPYENNSVTYEDYVTEAITKVTMRGTANDVGTSVGVDGNEYIITNNPLIYGTEGTQTLVTAITNLLNKISQVTFRPYSLGKTIGNPCVELGDSITISTRYQTINSYVIKRVLSGIQALRDSYSATGYKVYPKEVNSIQEQINRTQGKMNELSRTVDETVSTVTRVEQIAEAAQETADGLVDDVQTANNNASTALSTANNANTTAITAQSQVTQMADQIVLKVDNNGNVVKVALASDASTGSNVLIKGDNIQLDGNVTITSGFRLTAGVIQSANYVAGQNGTGTKIDLTTGVLETTNAVLRGTLTAYNRIKLYSTYNNYLYDLITYNWTSGDDWEFYINAPNGGSGQQAIIGFTAQSDVPKFYGSVRDTTLTANRILISDSNKNIVSSGYEFDINTNNTSDTWLLVMRGSKIQHRLSTSLPYVNVFNAATTTLSSPNELANYGDAFAMINGADGNPYGLSQWMHYINMTWDGPGHAANWIGQIAMDCYGGDMFWRASDGDVRNKGWKALLDSGNYMQYALPLSGGNVTGKLRLNNISELYNSGNTLILGSGDGVSARKYNNLNTYILMSASGFVNQSSRLVKENVEPITEDDARKLLNIEVVSFDYIKEVGGEKNKVGMIAEDVLKIYPELVNVPENYSEEKAKESIYEGNNTETLGLDYAKFTPYLIKMVQMQQKEIDDLKKLIKTEE